MMIHQFQNLLKRRYIRYAFKNLKVDVFGGLIQFWAPVKNAGRWILTTSDQPFLVDEDDELLGKYRLCSLKYKYNIDGNYLQFKEDPAIISPAAPATAFLNRMPELLTDLRVDRMSQLESSALERGLIYSFVLPVFYPSQSCCVGVVEYSTSSSHDLLDVFNKLNIELEKVGLKTFQAREHLPYDTICGLKHAKNEIDDALMSFWEMHSFDSAQVWIACEEESHVAFTSSLEDTRTKRMIGLKLTGHHVILDDEDFELQQKRLKDYGRACYSLPLKMDEGLSGKTLENYEPHFIQNISELSHNKPQRFLSMCYDYSCFVIYLRSSKTGDLVYVFEFLWIEGGNRVILLESLLLKLMECLPNFKFASGAQLGDEIDILDVENSTESEIKYFKIFQTNKLSPVSVTPKRGRRREVEECLSPLKAKCKTTPIPLSQGDIKLQFGKTMMEAAKNLNVSLSTLKRKCKALGIPEWHGKDYLKRSRHVKHSYKNQNDTSEEDKGGSIQDLSANNGETYLDENTMTIKVEYADDMIKFHLPISSATFVAIEKEIRDNFKLNPSDYKVKYLDEDGDWILLTSDKDMRVCIQNQRNLNINTIKMRVLQRQI